ncbi:Mediator of RNA polymerase II transcription subunit 16 [Frankliniella fusca]|uniref:Mediator of RNA polymerase II transcription subunit 16 n=1 Tax=Frankliniella fusca TaxID=407009 RepID=A0AAE1GTN3_9NEOP|nr:Mediator of RNA polymerase II transcription subunit 16 [Frankliniella fusca]
MTLSSVAATLATLAALAVLLVPPAAPRPAQHDVALLKGHAADGLGLGMGMGGMGFGRPALALPYLGQDDDDLPIIGKRAVAARLGPGGGAGGAVANLVARQDLGSQDSADYGSNYDEFPVSECE